MAKFSLLASLLANFRNNPVATHLELVNLDLEFFPDWFFDDRELLSRVIELDLSHNKFSKLTLNDLNRFPNLQKINLADNPLDFPEKLIESQNPHLMVDHLAQIQIDEKENQNQINQLLHKENVGADKEGFFVRLFNALYDFILNIPFISKSADQEVESLQVTIKRMPLPQKSKIWESLYGPFPRPINEQHLSSYAALRAIMKELSLTSVVIINCLVSFILWIIIGYSFNQLLFLLIGDWWIEKFYRLWLFFSSLWVFIGFLPVAVISLIDGAWNLWKPYYGFEQRETYGTAKWLLPKTLHYTYGWLYRFQPLEEIDKSLKSFIIKNFLWISMKTQVGKVPTSPIENGMFPIAPFGCNTWFCLPLAQISRHAIIFGIPGSGKSASFAMNYVRTAGQLGSAVVMDIKAELSRHCSHKFKQIYRFDFEESSYSDRFLLGQMCRNDLEFAMTLAQSIVGFRPGDKGSGGNESYFQSSAVNLLAALLLHLAEINTNFTPGDILQFLADHPFDMKNPIGFIQTLSASTNAYTRKIITGMPVKAEVTFEGIKSNMTTSLQTFENPHVMKVLSPPTEEEIANGCRLFDPMFLRQPSTGLFIVVPEGKADQIGNVTGSIINVIGNALRRAATKDEMQTFLLSHAARMLTSDFVDQKMESYQADKFQEFYKKEYYKVQQELYKKFAALQPKNELYVVPDEKIDAQMKLNFNKYVQQPEFFSDFAEQIREIYLKRNNLESILDEIATVFFIIDEAGNVKLSQLRQDTGVGRGRKMSYILFYHNIAQIYVQFGKDYAETLLGTVALRIFLPGLEGETAKYASFICRRTTTLQKSGTDSNTDAFDSSRLQETGRELRTEDEIRTMAEQHQALIVASSLDPMLTAFPPLQFKIDPTVTHPKSYSTISTPATYEKYRQEAVNELGMTEAFATVVNDLNDQLVTSYDEESEFVPSVKKHTVNKNTILKQPKLNTMPQFALSELNAMAQNANQNENVMGFKTEEKPKDDPPPVVAIKTTKKSKTKSLLNGSVSQTPLFDLLNVESSETENLLKVEGDLLIVEDQIIAQSNVNNELDALEMENTHDQAQTDRKQTETENKKVSRPVKKRLSNFDLNI